MSDQRNLQARLRAGNVEADWSLRDEAADTIDAAELAIAELARALAFWLPRVPEHDDEIAERVADDVYLLLHAPATELWPSAEERGWIAVRSLPANDLGHTARTLVAIGLLDEAAVEDPEGYDACVTMMQVHELHKLIARDSEDARLFRLWIEEASVRPSRVANAIAACTTPDEYRAALRTLPSIPYTGPQAIARASA